MAGQSTAGPKRKERMQASFTRGEQRKKFRAELQRDAEVTNRKTVAEGGLKPWAASKARRAENRRALQMLKKTA